MPTTRNNYSLQAEGGIPTMTVRELKAALEALPDDMPAVILSPKFGTFGSEMPYGIAAVEHTVMPRMEQFNPANTYEDDETGEVVQVEADTQVWPEWRGIVLQAR